MSLKRSHHQRQELFWRRRDAGAKVDRQELFDELKRLSAAGDDVHPR